MNDIVNKKKGQVIPVPSLKSNKVLQPYFAAGAAPSAFFSSAFFAFFAFFTFFTFFAFATSAFSTAGAAAGAATGSAAITVVQNAKTNAITNNPKRFILKSSF
jgi:hypothetical protein